MKSHFITMRIKEVLLACKVQEGMFDNEYAVEITLPPPATGTVSLFADKSLVTKEGGEYYIKVGVVDEEPQTRERKVLLPTECFEKGSRWLAMPEERLLTPA